MTPQDILDQLTFLGFSPTEGRVYLSLLRAPGQSGYQIGRDLGLSRSSVYGALDSLVRRRAIYLIPGETRTYRAEDPPAFLGRLQTEITQRTEALSRELPKLTQSAPEGQYLNIEGLENIREKTRELLRQARQEVFINTDFPLTPFQTEFQTLQERGIRVIVFSFQDLRRPEIPVEFYHSPPEAPAGPGTTRLMIAVDRQYALIAGRSAPSPDQPVTGTFSSNPLLVSIVSEHIHHDIYLLRLRRKYGHDPSEDGIRLNTGHERLSGQPRLRPANPSACTTEEAAEKPPANGQGGPYDPENP